MEIEIGDLVYHIFTDSSKGALKVIGTLEIPYKHSLMGDIYPLDGKEVLLAPTVLEKGKFEPFIHAMKADLRKL